MPVSHNSSVERCHLPDGAVISEHSGGLREIGIRRAIGAKRRQIIYQFLVETVVLSTTGGLVGLGMGAVIPSLITHFSGMTTILTWKGIILPLLISMTIGIMFGLYPAIHAAKVDPIIALRHE